jgi:hypothetical protein
VRVTSEGRRYVSECNFEGEGLLVNVTVEMRHRW